MDVDKLGRRVAAIRRRAATLRRRADNGSIPDAALVAALFGQLTIALDQLTLAREELRRQQGLLAPRPADSTTARRYHALYEFAPCAYLVTDLDGTIQDLNRAARDLLNLPESSGGAASPIGGSVLAFVAEADRPAFARELIRLRWVDWLRQLRGLSLRLQPCDRAPLEATVTVVGIAAGNGKLDTLAWLLQATPAPSRRLTEAPVRSGARAAAPDPILLGAPEMASRVDDDLMPVVGAVGLSLRHPNLPPDLRLALGQAAVALDGAVQWMAKLRQVVRPDRS